MSTASDVRFALRLFSKSPIFTLTSLLSLAVIGLGSIAGFSTSHFWISAVLSLGSIAAAVGAVLSPHRR